MTRIPLTLQVLSSPLRILCRLTGFWLSGLLLWRLALVLSACLWWVGIFCLVLMMAGCVRPLSPLPAVDNTMYPVLGEMAAREGGLLPASVICTHLEQVLYGVDLPVVVSRLPTKVELQLSLLAAGYQRIGNGWVYSGNRAVQAVLETRLVRSALLVDSVPTIDLSAGVIYSASLFTVGSDVVVDSAASRSERRAVQSLDGGVVVESSRETVSAGVDARIFIEDALVSGWYSAKGAYSFSAFTQGLDTRSSRVDFDVLIRPGEWVTVQVISSVDVALAASLKGLGLRVEAGADAVAVQLRLRTE